jgi:PPOX class probable F420-dependent enzyme
MSEPFPASPEQSAFLSEHRWALLATTRSNGAPQVSMLAYHYDGSDIVFSIRSTTAKWANTKRQASVVVTVTDGERYLSVSGNAERIATDPLRMDLTVRLQNSLEPRHHAMLQADIEAGLDSRKRVILRITPERFVGRL